jgi:hypothetical protein
LTPAVTIFATIRTGRYPAKVSETRKHSVLQGMGTMQTEVELEYIPRSLSGEPRVRLMIFREDGNAILDFGHSAIAEVRRPDSEGGADMLLAFRESVPFLLRTLNETIAATPPGDVLFVTAEMLRSNKIAAA